MTPGGRIARAVLDLILQQTDGIANDLGILDSKADLAREVDAALPPAESPAPAPPADAVKGAELAPCPFCGGLPNALEETEGAARRWWCQCGECGADSRAFGSRAEAVTAWNHRPSAPAPPAPRQEGEAPNWSSRQCIAMMRDHLATVGITHASPTMVAARAAMEIRRLRAEVAALNAPPRPLDDELVKAAKALRESVNEASASGSLNSLSVIRRQWLADAVHRFDAALRARETK